MKKHVKVNPDTCGYGGVKDRAKFLDEIDEERPRMARKQESATAEVELEFMSQTRAAIRCKTGKTIKVKNTPFSHDEIVWIPKTSIIGYTPGQFQRTRAGEILQIELPQSLAEEKGLV